MGTATQILVAQWVGAGEQGRIHHLLRAGAWLLGAVATVCALVLLLAGRRLEGPASAPETSGPVLTPWWKVAWPDITFGIGGYGTDLAIVGIVAALGAEALSGHRIIGTTTMVLFVVGFSCSAGISILVGQRLGADDPVGARAFVGSGTALSAMVIGLVALPVLLAPDWWVSLFASDPAVREVTAEAIRVFLIIAPAMVIALPLAGLVRGSGDTRPMKLVGLGSQVMCALPVAYLLVHRAGMGLLGAALGLAAGWVVRALLTWWQARRLPAWQAQITPARAVARR